MIGVNSENMLKHSTLDCHLRLNYRESRKHCIIVLPASDTNNLLLPGSRVLNSLVE